MASTVTSEFVKAGNRAPDAPFSMIERKGLLARLAEELALAWHEIARDPRGFIRDLTASDTRDGKRRRLVYIGLATAVVTHAALFVLIITLGWPRILAPNEGEPELKVDQWVKLNDQPEIAKAEEPRGDNGGGGGGGQQSELSASHGAAPQMLPTPSPVDAAPPLLTAPSLPVPSNIIGPESLPPPPDVPVGVPDAKGDTLSPGPGTGGGLGAGTGGGVGSGTGPGAGLDSGGGPGKDRKLGSPNSADANTSGPIDWNRLREIPGNTQVSWIYRPRPVVTPEATAKKVVGEVLLRATFNADGTISDIEVIRSDVPEMTESAIQSLEHSKFRPATIEGKPVTVRRVPVRVAVHY